MADAKTNAVNEALDLPLTDAFERELAAMLADEQSPTLAMMDLDMFDRVNKEFGHEEGDRVIIGFGRHIQTNVPADVKIYRYGGDEFACVYPERYEKEEVFLQMEALRKNFDMKLPDGAAQSLCVGIAAAPEDGETLQELVRKAEGAMFRGKAQGKNRVCLAREAKMITKTSHYTPEQLSRLTKLSQKVKAGEAVLLREALDALLKKYDV